MKSKNSRKHPYFGKYVEGKDKGIPMQALTAPKG
jgi:hypothetical protein